MAIVGGASGGVPASSRARFPCPAAGAEVVHVAPHVAATHCSLPSHPLGLAYPSCTPSIPVLVDVLDNSSVFIKLDVLATQSSCWTCLPLPSRYHERPARMHTQPQPLVFNCARMPMPSRSRSHAKGLANAAAGVQCSLRLHAKAKKMSV